MSRVTIFSVLKVFILGIHWAWHTVDDLRQYFDNFGTVEQVEILGNPRGLGFVVFESKSSADKCLEYGKIHVINGQNCEVTVSLMFFCSNGWDFNKNWVFLIKFLFYRVM